MRPFPSRVVSDARDMVKHILKEHGAQLDLDAVPERQPFYLTLLEQFLRLCGDSDAPAYFSGQDSFAAGVTLGVNHGMPRAPAVFEKKHKWRSYDGETAATDSFHCSSPGAAANAETIEAQFEEEAKLGARVKTELEEASKLYGAQLRIASLNAIPKADESFRVVQIRHMGSASMAISKSPAPTGLPFCRGFASGVTGLGKVLFCFDRSHQACAPASES